MGRRCIIDYCNKSNGSSSRTTFYGFPSNPEVRKRWISCIKATYPEWNGYVYPSATVCSKHFSRDCYSLESVLLQEYNVPNKRRKRLKATAVPDLLGNLKSFDSILPVPVMEKPFMKPERDPPCTRMRTRLQVKKNKEEVLAKNEETKASSTGQIPKVSLLNLQTTSACLPTVIQPVLGTIIFSNAARPATNQTISSLSQLTFNQLIPHVTGRSPTSKPEINLFRAILPSSTVNFSKNNCKPTIITAATESVTTNLSTGSNLLQLLLHTPSHVPPVIENSAVIVPPVIENPAVIVPPVIENTAAIVPPVTEKSPIIEEQTANKTEAVPSKEQHSVLQTIFQSRTVGYPESICEQILIEDSSKVLSFFERNDRTELQPQGVDKKDIPSMDGLFTSYNSHLKIAAKQRIPKCETCGKVFSSFAAVRRHQPMHTGEQKYKCNICLKSFTWQNSLTIHMKHHDSEDFCTCEHCGVVVPKENLKAHIEQKHILLKYEISQESIDSNQRLQNNHKQHLPGEFICACCGESCIDEHSLKVHLRQHHRKRQPCDQCSSTFVDSHGLLLHKRRCHEDGKKFECSVCGKKYLNTSQLNEHMVKHTDERPFKCNECGKTYRSRTTLKGHINHHRGIMPYACNYCGRRFLFHANKQKHERRHTGVRQFKCILCSKSFYEKQELQRHTLRHHSSADFIDISKEFYENHRNLQDTS